MTQIEQAEGAANLLEVAESRLQKTVDDPRTSDTEKSRLLARTVGRRLGVLISRSSGRVYTVDVDGSP